ncbi:unnamed protein product [Cyprideis torosa]|uniref:Uncharacterized protein n=1 Tax=Cyprideis torosa TaxID=163714 RepID=A0A7R8ZS34_9CRUS|nr:unnamed protein product [Cyprideis torosa]CAG0900597.1 unnamed protein product [Cyprideis torosa]
MIDLLKADRNRKNSDLKTPLDVVKEGDEEVADLMRGEAALLEASKKGSVSRVKNLVTLCMALINCRDSQARNSTPLHLAAGYNNLEVAEYLLENGADVNAQDKGGLIHLYNASSYGNLDIAAILIKYERRFNASDRWGFEPMHEASQKGRTQISILLQGESEPCPLQRPPCSVTPPTKLATTRCKDVVQLADVGLPRSSASPPTQAMTVEVDLVVDEEEGRTFRGSYLVDGGERGRDFLLAS